MNPRSGNALRTAIAWIQSARLACIVLALLATAACGWAWMARGALLDDALIHLRYARDLGSNGFASWSGGGSSYGTSSPLYVTLLAVARLVSISPLTTAALSTCAYLALVALAARSTRQLCLWLPLLVALSGPSAARWLTDGMETSLVALGVTVVPRLLLAPTSASSMRLPSAAIGFALLALRPDLVLAIGAFAVAACMLGEASARQRAVALLVGAGLAICGCLAVFGHLLPDTAVAKSLGPTTWPEVLKNAARSTASGGSLGVGLFGSWLLSLAAVLRSQQNRARWSAAAASLLVPLVLALIAHRGQVLHGIRPLLWVLLTPTVWNLELLTRRQERRLWKLGAVLAVAVLASWFIEGPRVAAAVQSRRSLLVAMSTDRLSALEPLTGAAFDVGFIGYFTGSRLFDAAGLVNGREFAELSTEDRLRRIAAASPDFLFLTADQQSAVGEHLALDTYVPCRIYPSTTLTGDDTHHLLLHADKRSYCELSAPPDH